MQDRPSGEELALLVREAGGEEPLVARCLAIAEREAQGGAAGFAACRAALVARYGEADDRVLLARLAAAIGAGIFDAPGKEREAVRDLLVAITVQKLRATAPDLLAAYGLA